MGGVNAVLFSSRMCVLFAFTVAAEVCSSVRGFFCSRLGAGLAFGFLAAFGSFRAFAFLAAFGVGLDLARGFGTFLVVFSDEPLAVSVTALGFFFRGELVVRPVWALGLDTGLLLRAR